MEIKAQDDERKECITSLASFPVSLRKQVHPTTGARPKNNMAKTTSEEIIEERSIENVSSLINKELRSGTELTARQQLEEYCSVKLVRKTEVSGSISMSVPKYNEHYASMVSHQCVGTSIHLSSMASHQVWKGKDVGRMHSLPSHQVAEPDSDKACALGKEHPSTLQVVGRKILYRSCAGVWGQVYRARCLDQVVVARRAQKRRASTEMDDADSCVPCKRRKLIVEHLAKQGEDQLNTDIGHVDHYLVSMVAHQVPFDSIKSLPSTVSHRLQNIFSSSSNYSLHAHTTTMDMVLSLPDTHVHTDHGTVLCTSMLAHRVENSHGYTSCTLLSHRGSTSFHTPSTSFLSYKNEPRSKVCSNESSFLCHQIPRFLQTPMSPFPFQYEESFSSLHTISPQNFGPVKRSFEEDDQMVVSLPKKKRLSQNYGQMVSDLLLAVIADVVTPQDPPESLLVTDNTESDIASHSTFLTHQVME